MNRRKLRTRRFGSGQNILASEFTLVVQSLSSKLGIAPDDITNVLRGLASRQWGEEDDRQLSLPFATEPIKSKNERGAR